ncbi:MAG: orotidine-5'-phosphate decarboxylase [Candidatus Nealsonbacteria bacterium]|nr:orotidine-5'-phosphate decarboxylase [Candidatus Nealsonbacteria bacterium]
MKNFADRLLKEITKMENPSCIGLDPRIEDIPDFIKKQSQKKDSKTKNAIAWSFFIFNKMIIDATFDIVPAYKLQIAFYEKYGSEGIKALEKTINYLKKKSKIIFVDAKRNDIGPTAEAYSTAFLSPAGFDVDALTVNPYLGIDGVKPFIDDAIKYGKGIFVLVKTSNPSSGDFQDRILENKERLYEAVGKMVQKWTKRTEGKRGYGVVGAVVGATYPQQAKVLRKIMPKSIILVPGYGAQGGGAIGAALNFNNDGRGAIVHSARGIIFAWKQKPYKDNFKPKDFHLAAREAALAMKKDLLEALRSR